jgi:hypothetical protein
MQRVVSGESKWPSAKLAQPNCAATHRTLEGTCSNSVRFGGRHLSVRQSAVATGARVATAGFPR